MELLGVETYPEKICSQSWSDLRQNFNFRSHISAICNSCIYHIRDLRRIRRHLDLESAKLLANALVCSRLDYCNSVLSGIAETDLTKLQCILNRLTRVVTKSPPFTRSVPLLCSLHWLPVNNRVHFKICLLIYKALHEEQPVTFAPWSPLLRHHAHWYQKEESLCPFSRIGDQHWRKGLQVLRPFSLEQPFTICPFSHLGCHIQKTYQNIPFRLGLSPVDTGAPNGLLMLRNSFNDFVFEHRSGCCATEPGYAGDIDAIEIWLIDWLIDILWLFI